MDFFGDVFGGFMVMLFILGFFLVVLWFILPFVVFAMKGKLDSAHYLLENINQRLTSIESELRASVRSVPGESASPEAPVTPHSEPHPSSSGE